MRDVASVEIIVKNLTSSRHVSLSITMIGEQRAIGGKRQRRNTLTLLFPWRHPYLSKKRMCAAAATKHLLCLIKQVTAELIQDLRAAALRVPRYLFHPRARFLSGQRAPTATTKLPRERQIAKLSPLSLGRDTYRELIAAFIASSPSNWRNCQKSLSRSMSTATQAQTCRFHGAVAIQLGNVGLDTTPFSNPLRVTFSTP